MSNLQREFPLLSLIPLWDQIQSKSKRSIYLFLILFLLLYIYIYIYITLFLKGNRYEITPDVVRVRAQVVPRMPQLKIRFPAFQSGI